jgi:C-terminal peptidase prc
MPSRFTILLVLLSGLLLSCEEQGNLSRPLDVCSVEEQNRFVHEVLLERYFWYQEVPSSIDYGAFTSPEQTLSALRFDALDRFSNITNAAAFNNLLNAGQFIGYGFSVHIENDDSAWIRFVYDDSPAARAGMQRGQQIQVINGRPVAQILRDNAFNSIFGPPELDYPLTISLRDEEGADLDLSLEKAVVNINTVLHHSVVSNGSENVGYLVFNSFLSTSNAELEQVFSEFSSANIRKLVLDLRYNGGGSVSVAANLASYLYRSHQQDDIFATLIHNDKNQPRNATFRFNTLANALDLEQVIMIATEATCSASELVINGLQPFIDVRVVGNTTCGKPVGFNGFQFCDKLLLPVTFSSFNQNNEGDFFAGLAPECSVNDDIHEEFGAQSEPMLVQALHLSNTNGCLTSSRALVTPQAKQPYPVNSLRAISGAY